MSSRLTILAVMLLAACAENSPEEYCEGVVVPTAVVEDLVIPDDPTTIGLTKAFSASTTASISPAGITFFANDETGTSVTFYAKE